MLQSGFIILRFSPGHFITEHCEHFLSFISIDSNVNSAVFSFVFSFSLILLYVNYFLYNQIQLRVCILFSLYFILLLNCRLVTIWTQKKKRRNSGIGILYKSVNEFICLCWILQVLEKQREQQKKNQHKSRELHLIRVWKKSL